MRIMGVVVGGPLIKRLLDGAIVIKPLPDDAMFLYSQAVDGGVAYYFSSEQFDEVPEGGVPPRIEITSYDINYHLRRRK